MRTAGEALRARGRGGQAGEVEPAFAAEPAAGDGAAAEGQEQEDDRRDEKGEADGEHG